MIVFKRQQTTYKATQDPPHGTKKLVTATMALIFEKVWQLYIQHNLKKKEKKKEKYNDIHYKRILSGLLNFCFILVTH